MPAVVSLIFIKFNTGSFTASTDAAKKAAKVLLILLPCLSSRVSNGTSPPPIISPSICNTGSSNNIVGFHNFGFPAKSYRMLPCLSVFTV